MSSRLPDLSAREVVDALKKVDFQEIRGRGKGSYIYVHRADPPKGITIPNRKEIKRGLLRAIIRQAELSVEEFLKLL